MARGRMISKDISVDKKINNLSDDTSRLAFTWLIAHADREGRTQGDPAVVRALLFPRRSDITIEQMEGYIREWAAAGLIMWYEANDDLYIAFPNFDKHQVGLRKDREPESTIPPPPAGNLPPGRAKDAGELPDDCRKDAGELPDDCRKDAGELPDDCRKDAGELPEDIPVKLMEVKGIKDAPDGAGGDDPPPPEPPEDDLQPAQRLERGLVKNARALEALASHEARRAAGAYDWAWLAEHLVDLGKAFVEAAGEEFLPQKFEYSGWKRFLGEQFDLGLSPPDIKAAVKYCRSNGLNIKGPQSVTGIARDLKARRSAAAEEVFWEEH
jgi:hypothetical protein